MSHVVPIGKLIEGEEHRDAIHVAIAPVTAAHTLLPGQQVGFASGGDTETVSLVTAKTIGIVDPFLEHAVKKGERFWLFLFPNTITSLRHDWTHPDFGAEAEPAAVANADPAALSRLWIEQFAASIEQTYNRLMAAADQWAKYGEYTYDNSESYKDQWDKFPEFWEHYERVTGKTAKEKESFFTCSC